MPPAAVLGLYALVLAVVFAAALAVGGLVGPVGVGTAGEHSRPSPPSTAPHST